MPLAKIKKRNMQQQQKSSSSQQKGNKAKVVANNVIMERDVRLVEQQRHQSRAIGMAHMSDEAITKSSPKSH